MKVKAGLRYLHLITDCTGARKALARPCGVAKDWHLAGLRQAPGFRLLPPPRFQGCLGLDRSGVKWQRLASCSADSPPTHTHRWMRPAGTLTTRTTRLATTADLGDRGRGRVC